MNGDRSGRLPHLQLDRR